MVTLLDEVLVFEMKFYIKTFGCKVNQYESEFMSELLMSNGFRASNNLKSSDIIIINSCAVTSESDRKTRQFLHKARKELPRAIIVLCGCVPQSAKNLYNYTDCADIILGNSNRKDLLKYLQGFRLGNLQIIDVKNHENNEKYEHFSINHFKERTRAFVKIQDGCNNFCSYCLIPYTRGRERSKKIDDIRNELENLRNAGFKEIVFTGINLSSYGKEYGINLCDAIEIASSISGIERIRLSSVEPDFLSNEIIDRMSQYKKLCNHFHVCLQSGCDSVLRRMNRHYDTGAYRNVINKLRQKFNNCSITTDIISGFPGETESEFNATLEFVKEMQFTKIHAFPYSVRNGTKAANMNDQVDNSLKKIRCKLLSDVAQVSCEKFLNSQIGKIHNILFEKRISDNCYEGFSENYINAKVHSNKNLNGKILPVIVENAENNFLIGKTL